MPETRSNWSIEFYGDLEKESEEIIDQIYEDHDRSSDIKAISLDLDEESPHLHVKVYFKGDFDDE